MMSRPAYPGNWTELATECKRKANWTCQHCGARQFEIKTSRKGNPYYIYLHAAHALHCEKSDPQPELLCLCISCHGKLDYTRKVRDHRIRMECLRHLKLMIERGQVTIKEY